MTRAEALAFLERERHGVLATLLGDGRPHPTPVVFALGEGAVEFSLTRPRVKTRNLRRDPRATLCVLPGEGWHPYLCVEGRVELIEDPDGRKNLGLYRRITGRDPDDTDEYLRAMRAEERLLARLSLDRLYPLG